MKRMRQCVQCETYTMQDKCPHCHKKTISPHPPKFSLDDKYGKYRRQIKKKALEENGNLS